MKSKAKPVILHIEDKKEDVTRVQQLLKNASMRCVLIHADTLFEGIDIIKQKTVNMVLLDLTLPDSNGFKTLSSFLEKVQNVPVIVLAETNNEIIGNQSIKAGAEDFLVKGQFDGRTLGRAIRYAIQRFKVKAEMQQATSELALNEKRYVEAQEMAHFGNWEMDIVTNKMQWTDEVFRIFGLKPNSFEPSLSEYLHYVPIEEREEVEDFFENASKNGKLHQLEHRIVTDGHNIKHIVIRGKINYEKHNNKLILVGVIQDISERKLNEQLILEKNISNSTSQTMQQALSDMSFNVRTPLSSIINFVYLLKNTNLSIQQQEFLDALKVSVDDMSLVLHNLFNLVVLASDDLKIDDEDLRIGDFLASHEKALHLRADISDVGFRFSTNASLPDKIRVDSKQLTLIFYNIINYLSSEKTTDGLIHIYTSVNQFSDTSGNLCLQFYRENLKIPISEIQSLLASEKLLELLDPRTDTNKNTALSMAIVLRLARHMGGKFHIQNKSADTTSFQLEVPVQIVPAPALTEAGKPAMPLHILLVEDHFLNQIATKKILCTWSDMVRVDIAENGLIAVEKYREYQHDIIIMDIQMPVMDGIEAANKIRQKSKVPIIALTANSSKQEQDRCLATGINAYLPKPFAPDDLFETIMQELHHLATVQAEGSRLR